MDEIADQLKQALRVAGRARHILLATADATGTPRFTPIESCTPAGSDRLAIRAWIDVSPLDNRCGAGRLALLVWEEDGHGYQLTGQMVRLGDTAVLDGWAEIEQQVHFPQIERTLLMQVDSIEEFHFAPAEHSAPGR